MVRMIMHGYSGAMGQVITGLAADDKDIEVVAGIDLHQGTNCSYPVFTPLGECNASADVIVDFASVETVDGLLKFSAEIETSVVLCTMGLSREQLTTVKRTDASAAVLRSVNMFLDVDLLPKLVQDAARVLVGSGFNIEIVEKYHNQKTDALGGTVIVLVDSINGAMEDSYEYVYDRSGKRKKRSPKEIGISAVRGGSIVGEHDVIFAGRDEVVTFSHMAYPRAIFAKGALEATKFLAGKDPGPYTMADVVQLR